MKPAHPVAQFLVVFLWVTALITLTGAVLGAAIWPLAGLVFDSGREPGELALTGLRTLGFYFFIWAPGTGIVVATIKEWRRQHPETGA